MCTDQTADKTPQHLKCPETGRLKSKGHGTWDQCDRPDQKNLSKMSAVSVYIQTNPVFASLGMTESIYRAEFWLFCCGVAGFQCILSCALNRCTSQKASCRDELTGLSHVTEKTSPRWPTVLISHSKVSPFYPQGKVDTSSTFPRSVFNTPVSAIEE